MRVLCNIINFYIKLFLHKELFICIQSLGTYIMALFLFPKMEKNKQISSKMIRSLICNCDLMVS